MRWAWGACAAIAMVWGLAAPCAGQLRLVAETPSLGADPGDFVTAVFTVFNDGPAPVQVDFELELPPALTALGAPPPLELAAGGRETLFLTVTVSAQAAAGELVVGLRARLAADPAVFARAQAVVAVRQRLGLRVQPPPERTADLLEIVTLTFRVTNEGNAMDEVALSVEGPASVPARLATGVRLALLPGETRPVEVTATVSAEARPGRVRILLRAASTLFPEVVAQALATVTVLPLRPEDVGGRLVLAVPSELRFAATLGDATAPPAFAWTLSGAADFDEADRIDYAATVEDLALRALRFELVRDPFDVRLGRLNLSFGRLLTLSGAGAQGGVRGLFGASRWSLGALSQAGAPQWAWGADAAFGGLEAGLAHLVRFRDDGTFDQLAGVVLTQPLGPSVTVSSEWAASDDGGLRDLGALFDLRLELDAFSLQAGVFRVGGDFRGNRADEVGFELSQFFSLDESLALATRLRRAHDNVNGAPGVATEARTAVTANLRWRAFEAGPELTSAVDFDGVEVDALARSSRLAASLRLTQPLGQTAAAGAFLRRELSVDAAGPSRLERVAGGLELALNAPRLAALLRATQTAEVDLVAPALTFRDLEALARVTLSSETAALTLGLTRRFGALSLDAQLEAGVAGWTASAALGLEREDGGALDLDVRLALAAEFEAFVPFIPVSGRVQGRVFVDADGDGARGPDEAGVGEVVLALGDVQARTDERGFFRTPPLAPGRYEVTLERLPLQIAAAFATPRVVEVVRGQTLELDLPVTRVAAIEGVVFEDADQDGLRGPGEGGLAGVIVQLAGAGASRRAVPSADGAFAFGDLRAGDYTVSVNPASLPPRAEPTTPAAVTLTLGPGERAAVAFGVFQRPQAIVFAPTAEFSVSPAAPRAGQSVTFDGGLSFDPDGQVVAHAWDFDGDGQADAQGQVVTFVFAAPGRFPVTLTVTDDGGNRDSETKTVEVTP